MARNARERRGSGVRGVVSRGDDEVEIGEEIAYLRSVLGGLWQECKDFGVAIETAFEALEAGDTLDDIRQALRAGIDLPGGPNLGVAHLLRFARAARKQVRGSISESTAGE